MLKPLPAQSLGARIRVLRQAHAWSQIALGKEAGLPQDRISALETGLVARIRLPTLRRLCLALHVSPDQLLGSPANHAQFLTGRAIVLPPHLLYTQADDDPAPAGQGPQIPWRDIF